MIDGSVQSLCVPAASPVLPEPGLSGTGGHSGLRSCGARGGTRVSWLEEADQTEGSTGGAFCLLMPGLRLA